MDLKKVVLVEYYSGTEQELAIVRDAKDKENPKAYDSLHKLLDYLRAVE